MVARAEYLKLSCVLFPRICPTSKQCLRVMLFLGKSSCRKGEQEDGEPEFHFQIWI